MLCIVFKVSPDIIGGQYEKLIIQKLNVTLDIISNCHGHTSIDAKDRIAEDTSIDSFIAGFELAWKLSMELNHYEDERSVSCRTAMGLGACFASKEEEK